MFEISQNKELEAEKIRISSFSTLTKVALTNIENYVFYAFIIQSGAGISLYLNMMQFCTLFPSLDIEFINDTKKYF